MLRSWFTRPQTRKTARRGQLWLKHLEDRCVPAALQPSLSFQDAPRYYDTPEPSSYLGIVAADFNRDGFADVAATTDTGSSANGFTSSLIVRLNNRDGTLGAPTAIALGGRPVKPVAADFNGDGKIDLAVTRSLSNVVAVLIGNGDGTFQAPLSFAVQLRPEGMVAGDFDRDGRVDLAVGNYDSQSISILRGNGNGTFQAAQTQPTAFAPGTSFRASPTTATSGDFNGDGSLDLAFGAIGNYPVSVFLGNGDGTFQAARALTAESPYSVAAGDLNGDGLTDLVAGSFGATPVVNVFISQGDGNFVGSLVPAGPAGEGYFRDIAITDLDRNGRPDVIAASWGLGSVTVLPGNGDGTFQEARLTPVGGLGNALTTADFNRDGRPDVAAAAGTQVSVLMGDGKANFRQAPAYSTVPAPNEVVTGDFNRDGRPDIASSSPDGNVVSVRLNLGGGKFGPEQTYAAGGTVTSLAAGDFNNDGVTDLATANGNGANSISVLRGLGDGTFAPAQDSAVPGPYALTLGDFNRDGRLDAVVLSNAFPYDTYLLLGNGDGTLGAPQVIGSGPYMDIVAADFNRDGRLDLATAFRLSPSSNRRTQVTIRLNNGDGTFTSFASYVLVNTRDNSRLHVSDVNVDGRPDILVSNSYRSTVYVLLGNANGTLRFADGGGFDGAFIQGGLEIDAVGVADFNGDGVPDLATAGGRSNFYVQLGNGDGSFRPGANFGVGIRPAELAVADFNGDGRPDAAVANGGSATVSILINTAAAGRGGDLTDREPMSPGGSPRPAPSAPFVAAPVAWADTTPAPAATASRPAGRVAAGERQPAVSLDAQPDARHASVRGAAEMSRPATVATRRELTAADGETEATV